MCMKAVSILLFVLFLSTGVQAKSIQCEGIALSTGVQCKKKIATKHNTTLCHHHKYTNHLEAEKIDFNNIDTTTSTHDHKGIQLFCLCIVLMIITGLAYEYFLNSKPKYYS